MKENETPKTTTTHTPSLLNMKPLVRKRSRDKDPNGHCNKKRRTLKEMLMKSDSLLSHDDLCRDFSRLPPDLVLCVLQFFCIPLRCYIKFNLVEDADLSRTDVPDEETMNIKFSDEPLLKLLFGYFKADSFRTIRRLYTHIDTRGCNIYKHKYHKIVSESNFWNILNCNYAHVKHNFNPFKGAQSVSITYLNSIVSQSSSEKNDSVDAGLIHAFKDSRHLTQFSLEDRNKATFKGLSWLCCCKKMVSLKLCHAAVTVENVIHLVQQLPNLKAFLLNGIKLSQQQKANNPFNNTQTSLLSETIAKHPSITSLELSLCHLNEQDLCLLLNNKKITSLKLKQNCITSIPTKPEEVACNTTLKRLDLSYNTISSDGVISLFSWLSEKLTNLKVCSCKINENGLAFLFSRKHLRRLDISKNNFRCEAFKYLEQNKELEHLDISGSYLCEHVVQYISRNESLTSLNLVSCHMDDRIGTLLFKNTTRFKKLVLAENMFTSLTLKHILKNKQLHTLDYSSVKSLTSKGCESLSKHPSLKTLRLYKNNIQSKGAHYLFSSKIITSLNLSKNKVGDEACRMLASNTSLLELTLWSNQISDKGVNIIFNGNKTLTTINLLTNELTEKAHILLKKNGQLLLGGSIFC